MKTKLIVLLSICIYSASVFAQESIIAELDNRLLEKYIALARQNFPRKKTFDAKETIAKSNFNAAQLSWFDIFQGSYLYSPQTQKGSIGIIGNTTTGTSQLVTQGFMAGINVNLGNLFSKPSVIKAAKANYEIAKLDNAEYDAVLANEVKARYYAYLLARKTLQIRSLSSQNLKSIMNDVKLKYERAEIPIDVYTLSRNTATESEALALTSEVEFLKAKNALEEIIGTTLENVK